MSDIQNDQHNIDNVETLFHDIATPLLIAKMKAELLTAHLPLIIKALNESPDLRHLLPEGEKLANALMDAPEIMLSNLKVVQKKINMLSTSLVHQTNTFLANDMDVSHMGGGTGSSVRVAAIKTILLVDDEEVHRDIGERLLSSSYEVDFAKNGLEALTMCEQKHYDLILMDLHMPKMNGEQATIALRPRISQQTIIIGLTSLPIGVNRSGLLAMGFTDFLEKPLSLKSLQKLLQTHSLNA